MPDRAPELQEGRKKIDPFASSLSGYWQDSVPSSQWDWGLSFSGCWWEAVSVPYHTGLPIGQLRNRVFSFVRVRKQEGQREWVTASKTTSQSFRTESLEQRSVPFAVFCLSEARYQAQTILKDRELHRAHTAGGRGDHDHPRILTVTTPSSNCRVLEFHPIPRHHATTCGL